MKKCLVFFFLFSFTLQAQELKNNEWSLSMGYLFEGSMYLWRPNQYQSVGGTILFKGDWIHYFQTFNNKLGAGLYYNIGFPYYGIYGNVTMAELGGALKARFNVSEKFLLKPSVLVGYRTYSSGGTGLGVNGSVALQYQGKLKPYFEFGILAQPAGGNSSTDITYSPLFHTSIGLTF